MLKIFSIKINGNRFFASCRSAHGRLGAPPCVQTAGESCIIVVITVVVIISLQISR